MCKCLFFFFLSVGGKYLISVSRNVYLHVSWSFWYLVIMLKQYAHDSLHTLGLYGLSCKTQQVLQSVCGVAGLTQVNVKSGWFTGFGQSKFLRRNLLKRHLLWIDDNMIKNLIRNFKKPDIITEKKNNWLFSPDISGILWKRSQTQPWRILTFIQLFIYYLQHHQQHTS